ncbi:urea carboxylase-associated family protein [Paraburkholderia sp. SARCC-3016]|uniref:urea carboxylase-associated family protein n=1 Tax=Paraburkholderia sp. SARCC-3016 TaxID=3058611 RepID=UPI00280899FB|nr:urea carboxylase-associated family protein [Paraburkholderia sp. SARCC-3016]MDQ7977338.1 urea carboxylase-associated family protein [Paraburkholderia sp. SARCC-3016]
MSEPILALTVKAGHGRAFQVKAGQFLTITDVEGQQAADFVAVVQDDMSEKLSPVHTRRQLRSLFFDVGDSLYSSLGRPLLRVVEDTVGIHDANVPACDDTRFAVDFNVTGHRNCLDNMHSGLALYGLSPFDMPEPFNLFQNGPVTPDRRMQVTDPTSNAGDRITFEVLEDLLCAVSSCPQDIIPGNGLRVTDIAISVHASPPSALSAA